MGVPTYWVRTLYVEDFNLGRAINSFNLETPFLRYEYYRFTKFYQVLRFTSVKSTADEWFFSESFSIILASPEYLSFSQRLNRTVQRPKTTHRPSTRARNQENPAYCCSRDRVTHLARYLPVTATPAQPISRARKFVLIF